ncbi:M15 family metallopeptidase [Argonema antarcticum]|nr:M15 family metallopeptidase [Argonema antarcticum]
MLKNVQVCPTSSVTGLSEQLIAEIQRIDSNLLVSFTDLNVAIREDQFPLLRLPAKEALRRAIKARDTTLIVNSAYRTIAQQYLLYKQYKENRCGISLAAKSSNGIKKGGF